MDYATHIIRWVIIALLVVGFLLAGWRDFLLLFIRPTARLGTGLSRIWSVARVTIVEAWYHRVWLVVVLHVIAFGVLTLAVRPFDESERIPLYIQAALTIQLIVVLVPFWALASRSLPLERERKIIVTNATKPISRFELMVGKMVGMSAAAGILLVLMGLVTWGMLEISNQRLKARAMAEYRQAETDYRVKAQRPGEDRPIPPPQEKLTLAQEGSLFAYNYVTPRPGNFSVVGRLDTSTTPPTRFIKGGSHEAVVYRFPGGITAPMGAVLGPPGSRPAFDFYFPAKLMPFVRTPPQRVEIAVSVTRAKQPLQSQDKTLALSLDPNRPFRVRWEPDRPEELFGVIDPRTGMPEADPGPLDVRVSCPTPGVWLQVFDGAFPDANGNMPSGTNFNVFVSPQPNVYFQPYPDPVVTGFERRGSQQIAGPDFSELARGDEATPLEIGVFKFKGEDLRNVPVTKDGNFTLSLFLDVDKEKNGDLDTQALVSVFNEATPNDVVKQPVRVVEKRRTEVTLPASVLGNPDPSKRSDMYVLLYCETPGHWLGALPTSARIERPASPFLVNLLKSEATIWFEASLLIVVAVACSVRLDWPLAMLASATVVALGFVGNFVASLQEYGGLNALNMSPYGNHGATWRFFDQLAALTWKSLNVIVHLLPDFSRYDSVQFIMELRNRPWIVVGTDLVATAAYVLPVIVLGYLLIRKQELG
jgi:hypothetical protein